VGPVAIATFATIFNPALKLHRTKCGALIKNVILSAMKEDLIMGLQDKKYAIIIDESTGITTQKRLYISGQYFGDKSKKL